MALPITDTIAAAVAQLVDDSKSDGEYREPSHSDIEFCIKRSGLESADPKLQGQVIGKAKRVRAVLYWALDNDPNAGAKFIEQLLSKVRALGGFREGSPNFVSVEAIRNLAAAFDAEGFVLSNDGDIRPKVLDSLTGKELSGALMSYARRARKGAEDAALVVGTGKDLIEATAAHVLQTKFGSYPLHANFQALLGQAYIALEMAVPEEPVQPGEPVIRAFERAMFQSACAINRLRNKEGTGHGRPWLPTVTDSEARAAVEQIGSIASFLLERLRDRR